MYLNQLPLQRETCSQINLGGRAGFHSSARMSNRRGKSGLQELGDWTGPLLERKKGLEKHKEQLDVEEEVVGVHQWGCKLVEDSSSSDLTA